jgi:hypothetical protein
VDVLIDGQSLLYTYNSGSTTERSWNPERASDPWVGMAVQPVGAGARGCQTHWVRVWVSNRTRGCTHTCTHNKPGRGRVWISTRG